MPLHYHDGSVLRLIKELHYHDGGALRDIKQAWYHDGGALRLVFQKAIVLAPGAGGLLISTSRVTAPDTATAAITMYPDGQMQYQQGYQQTVGSFWHSPLDATAGQRYWVYFGVSGGNLTFGTPGVWHPLTSQVQWGVAQAGPGFNELATTAYIATDAGGSNIISTGQQYMSVTVDPEPPPGGDGGDSGGDGAGGDGA